MYCTLHKLNTPDFQKRKPSVPANRGGRFLSSLTGAVVLGTFVVSGGVQSVRGEEFLHRECDALEQVTGITAAAAGAFFLGHAVIKNRNEQLAVTLQTNDGELAQRDKDDTVFLSSGEVAVEALADTGRDLADVAVTAAVGTPLNQFGVQNDRIDSFHHCNRKVAAFDQLPVQCIDLNLRGEDLGAAFAAEQDHSLVEYAEALHLHRAGTGAVGIQGNAVEVSHVNGVVAAVEGNRFYVNVSVEKFRSAAFYRLGAAEYFLAFGRGEEAQILHTILVSAGIIDLFRMDANGLAGIPLLGIRTEVGEFRHNEPPIMEQ